MVKPVMFSVDSGSRRVTFPDQRWKAAVRYRANVIR